MKLFFISILMLFANSSFADSPGASKLFGITKSGERVMLTYEIGGFDTGEPYYFVTDKKYGICKFSSDRGKHLYCSKKFGAAPEITYEYGYADSSEAAKIYDQNIDSASASYEGYYHCTQGCKAEYVNIFIIINDFEGGGN